MELKELSSGQSSERFKAVQEVVWHSSHQHIFDKPFNSIFKTFFISINW